MKANTFKGKASLIRAMVLVKLSDENINDNDYLWNAEALIRELISREYPHMDKSDADQLATTVWEDVDARRDKLLK